MSYSKWPEYQPYWVRKGTRKPLPGLLEAIRRYGEENVNFSPPKYVQPGYCRWCGKKIENKRRTSFCCDECSREYNNLTVWGRGRNAYSYKILCRDNFTCQDCGEFHAFQNEHSVCIPIDDGQLEVHHIKPVSEGGGDEPSNLITLCKNCHQERHRKLNEEKRNV